MKYISAFAILLLMVGCAETVTSPERSITPLYDASGLGASAYVGVNTSDSKIEIVFEPSQTTPERVRAAPINVCQHLMGTVQSTTTDVHPSPEFYPTARVLKIKCSR